MVGAVLSCLDQSSQLTVMNPQAWHVSDTTEPTLSLAACHYQAVIATGLSSLAGTVSSTMPSLQPRRNHRVRLAHPENGIPSYLLCGAGL